MTLTERIAKQKAENPSHGERVSDRSSLSQDISDRSVISQGITDRASPQGVTDRSASPQGITDQRTISQVTSNRNDQSSRESPALGRSLRHENMIIDSQAPISEVLTLKMINQLSEHGRMSLDFVIDNKQQMRFLQTNYRGQNIKLFQHHERGRRLIFNGHIETIAYEKQSHLLTASIEAASYSTFLDQVPRRRSFQNTSRSFRSLCNAIIGDATLRWEVGSNKAVNKPFVQYDETTFSFLRRVISHLRQPLQVDIRSEKPRCYAGVRRGRQQTVDEETVINMGVSDAYYHEKDGYARGESRLMYEYLQVRHKELWQIGDFVIYRNQRLTVVRQEAAFEKGELLFTYMLGAEGFLREPIIYADHLIGLSLHGVVRKAKKESIMIQFDIDREEQAHYYWRWTPEINNFGYVMPEEGSRAVLTFGTNEEKDAVATHLLRTNTGSPIYEQTENKIMQTIHDQLLGLFPNQIVAATKGAESSMSLNNQAGIRLDTLHQILINAKEDITINGIKVSVTAPEQILMQTPQSNIQMAGNFNFFAPSGVGTSSNRAMDLPPKVSSQTVAANPNHLPLSYAALGALPTGSLTSDGSEFPTLASVSALPSVGNAETAMVINEMMNGKKAEETSSPQVFESLASHTIKGGKPIPKNRKGGK